MSRIVIVALVLLALPAHADDQKEYELRPGDAVTLAAGAKGAASLTIAPTAGHRLDAGAPFSLRLSIAPASGVKLPRRRLALADAADAKAEAPRFDLPIVADTPGDYKLTADVRFWICAARTCRPVHDQVTIDVTVTAP
jgi:hypothetical protein